MGLVFKSLLKTYRGTPINSDEDGEFPGGLMVRIWCFHCCPGSIPGLAQWVKGSNVAVSCSVGQRRGSDLAVLWLWGRLASIAPI